MNTHYSLWYACQWWGYDRIFSRSHHHVELSRIKQFLIVLPNLILILRAVTLSLKTGQWITFIVIFSEAFKSTLESTRQKFYVSVIKTKQLYHKEHSPSAYTLIRIDQDLNPVVLGTLIVTSALLDDAYKHQLLHWIFPRSEQCAHFQDKSLWQCTALQACNTLVHPVMHPDSQWAKQLLYCSGYLSLATNGNQTIIKQNQI